MKKIEKYYKPTTMSVKSLFALAIAFVIKEDLPLSSKIKDIIRVCHGAIECNTPKEAVNVLCKGLEYKLSHSKWVVMECGMPPGCIGITNTRMEGILLALRGFFPGVAFTSDTVYDMLENEISYAVHETEDKTTIFQSRYEEWEDSLFVIEKVKAE